MKTDMKPIEKNPAPSAKGPSQALQTYVAESPLKALSGFVLATGGLLLLIYFGRIRFMPDLSIESATSLLYAIALIGLFIAGYIGLILVLPGLLLYWSRQFVKDICTRELQIVAVGATLIWLLLSLPMFNLIDGWGWITLPTSTGIAMGCGWLCQRITKSTSTSVENSTPYQGSCATSPGPAHPVAAPEPGFQLSTRAKHWLWGTAFTILFATVLTLSVLFFFTLGLTGDIRNAQLPELLLSHALMLLSVAGSALFIGTSTGEPNWKSLSIIGMSLLLLLLMLVGNFSGIAMLPISMLSQGEINTARIVVSQAGCQEINLALGESVCPVSESDVPAAICPVMLRSRIGSQAVLEFAPIQVSDEEKRLAWVSASKAEGADKERNLVRRVIIDKAKLLSWQPLLPGLPELRLTSIQLTGRPPLAKWISSKPEDQLDVMGKKNALVGEQLQELCGAPLAPPAAASAPPSASSTPSPPSPSPTQ